MNNKHVSSTVSETPRNEEIKRVSRDGIDRRDFLNCMEWAGTGLCIERSRRRR